MAAGHQLTVYDLRREATTNLCELGARWAETPRTVAAASEVVFTSLPGPAEVEQGVLDPATGILAGLRTGGAYIDMGGVSVCALLLTFVPTHCVVHLISPSPSHMGL